MKSLIQKSERATKKFAVSMLLSAAACLILSSQAWSFTTNSNHPATEQLAAGKEVCQVYTSGTNTWVYMCYLPYAYDAQPNRKWPTIIFQPCMSATDGSWGPMQGGNNCSGLSGYLYAKDTLHTIYPYQLHPIADSFIVVTPWQNMQLNPCYANTDALYREYYTTFLSHINATLRIDTMRINVMGECWGAGVAYHWVSLFPNVPASMSVWEINDVTNGCVDTAKACQFRNIPMRFVHSDVDPYIPVIRAKSIADAITRCGNPNVTWFLEAGSPHETWMWSAHSDKDTALYRWMLAQRKSASTSVADGAQNQIAGIPGELSNCTGKLLSTTYANDRVEIVDLHGQVLSRGTGLETQRMLPRLSRGIHLVRIIHEGESVTRMINTKAN